ncbi:hypothetical protein BV20DRAFT_985702 [Pilatotrama ljubarskyi]|nr:hypothetical protein BV20DRAFT_985702 [Pilatotrama ljubarskyi]
MSLSSIPVKHPYRVYLTLGPVLALGALTPTPSFTPAVLLLATLRLQTARSIPRREWSGGIAQLLLVSLAAGLVNAAPSLHALSTPATSLIVLACLSAAATTIAAGALSAGYYAERAARTHWVRATVFPAVWATTWAAVERLSPIGQLATWSPVTNLEGYTWLRQVGGQVAINWVVAAWAVIISEVAGAWMMGSDGEKAIDPERNVASLLDDDLPTLDRHIPAVRRSVSPKTRRILLMTGFLFAMTVPSYVISEFPPPVAAPDVTPFGVACAMPYPQRNGKATGPPSWNDYVKESKTLQSRAKIVLWPESAVHFNSEGEREEAFKRIQPQISNGTYYGIGFEEVVHKDSPDGVWKSGMRRNGLVLLGWEGVVYEYYKRHLVPIAESFSMTPSNEKPAIFTMQLSHPSSWTAPAWAPGPSFTRPIDITASICLDFTTASSFADLPSRPALILAPARTWHTSIGLAMWEQAKARAEESGSMVLWCDGGEGGVSGLAGRGMHAFRQVGPGSWAQTVSVPWPYDQRRTVFSAAGTSALAVVWGIMGMGWMAGAVAGQVEDREHGAGRAVVSLTGAVQNAVGFIRNLGQREIRGEERPLLGD